MRNNRFSRSILFVLSILLISSMAVMLMACGGEETTSSARSDDVTSPTATEPETTTDSDLTGVWNIVTENGLSPAANGYNSITLTLSGSTFVSAYDSDAASCSWSGTYATTPTTLTLTTDEATGPPCDQAVGKTKTAQLMLTAGGNTLTLDWTAEPMGTLQVYQRGS